MYVHLVSSVAYAVCWNPNSIVGNSCWHWISQPQKIATMEGQKLYYRKEHKLCFGSSVYMIGAMGVTRYMFYLKRAMSMKAFFFSM